MVLDFTTPHMFALARDGLYILGWGVVLCSKQGRQTKVMNWAFQTYVSQTVLSLYRLINVQSISSAMIVDGRQYFSIFYEKVKSDQDVLVSFVSIHQTRMSCYLFSIFYVKLKSDLDVLVFVWRQTVRILYTTYFVYSILFWTVSSSLIVRPNARQGCLYRRPSNRELFTI